MVKNLWSALTVTLHIYLQFYQSRRICLICICICGWHLFFFFSFTLSLLDLCVCCFIFVRCSSSLLSLFVSLSSHIYTVFIFAFHNFLSEPKSIYLSLYCMQIHTIHIFTCKKIFEENTCRFICTCMDWIYLFFFVSFLQFYIFAYANFFKHGSLPSPLYSM